MFNGADSQYANLHTYCPITKKKNNGYYAVACH